MQISGKNILFLSIVLFPLLPLGVFAQKEYLKSFWNQSNEKIEFKSVSNSNFMSIDLDSTYKTRFIYTKKEDIYFGVLQNYKESDVSKYIIQNKDILIVFYTSPYLHYPKTPLEVWNDIYYCIAIDLRVKEFISFQIAPNNTTRRSIGCGKKTDQGCYYASTFDFTGLNYNNRGPELGVELIDRIKKLRIQLFLKKLEFTTASCNLGVWYSYPWL
jgi:hypothetical protein